MGLHFPWKARIGGVIFPLGKQGLGGLHFPLESKDWWGYVPLGKQGLVGLHSPRKATLVLLCSFVVYLVDLSAAIFNNSPADGQPKTCFAVQALSRTHCMIVYDCDCVSDACAIITRLCLQSFHNTLLPNLFFCSGSDAKAASAKKTASPPSANHRGRPEARKSPPVARRQDSSSDTDSAR